MPRNKRICSAGNLKNWEKVNTTKHSHLFVNLWFHITGNASRVYKGGTPEHDFDCANSVFHESNLKWLWYPVPSNYFCNWRRHKSLWKDKEFARTVLFHAVVKKFPQGKTISSHKKETYTDVNNRVDALKRCGVKEFLKRQLRFLCFISKWQNKPWNLL